MQFLNLYIVTSTFLILLFALLAIYLERKGKFKKVYDLFVTIFCCLGAILLIFIALDFIYGFSSIIWENLKSEPYMLEFKDCVNTITQVVTFLGSSTIAAVSLYLSFGKKNDKQTNEKPVNEDSKSK